ncbi:DNA-binding GntR family transcriptional regulator [Rhodococcus sp. LBL1]|uniref:DNA-binding GntR family transcriptional regulator n=1 Tax=Prescottella agglutinans TaxID=1644129 RepID=A0ABT6MHW3_9NOCA|nr:GntR family transcriptional regulator [Prescottella agglutinans]MDH6283916.1 DNA-binding GntR family transcriptional regulator [Prescottella agglutinans]MDH6677313.1 DNA-binding GntR family transcriptional regulator [Rhodococcus sp. LBL1]MDH6682393.1 DNA-binding GntR family transcriptional regulator [Rhodococcus sp. LBL2]
MTVLNLAPGGPPESRREWLLKSLRKAITSGQLSPGDRLVERDISAQTGVSRGPVREAIMLLEQEGLVVSHSFKGAAVVGVSREEAENVLIPIRLVLEEFAFRHASTKLSDADFAHLESLIEEMRAAAAEGDRQLLADADTRFHEAVIVQCGWLHCVQVWRSISPRVRMYFAQDAVEHASLDAVPAQHEELLLALRTRDPDKSAQAAREHIADRPPSRRNA